LSGAWNRGSPRVLDLAPPFFGFIGLGFVAGRLLSHPEHGLAWMNAFTVYVALPALFAELANGSFVAVTMTGTAAAFALSFVTGLTVSRGDLAVAAMQGVAGAYSNIGYMAPGLTLAALGPVVCSPDSADLRRRHDPALHLAAVPDGACAPGGCRLVAHRRPGDLAHRHPPLQPGYGGGHPCGGAPMAAARCTRAAPHLAARRSGALRFVRHGVMVALRPMRAITPELPILLLVKLLLHPLIVWTLFSSIGGFDMIWVLTAVLMAALPPALNVFIMASRYQTLRGTLVEPDPGWHASLGDHPSPACST
jgi:hypothetical protein